MVRYLCRVPIGLKIVQCSSHVLSNEELIKKLIHHPNFSNPNFFAIGCFSCHYKLQKFRDRKLWFWGMSKVSLQNQENLSIYNLNLQFSNHKITFLFIFIINMWQYFCIKCLICILQICELNKNNKHNDFIIVLFLTPLKSVNLSCPS